MQSVKSGSSRPTLTSVPRSHGASAATLAPTPDAGAFAGVGTPQGAEFMHGPASVEVGEPDRGFSSSGEQQHAACLHLTPQPQNRLCSWGSKPEADETETADALPV